MPHIRLISVLLKLLENLDKWLLQNIVCGGALHYAGPRSVSTGCAYKSRVSSRLSYVQLQRALHCLQSAVTPVQSTQPEKCLDV